MARAALLSDPNALERAFPVDYAESRDRFRAAAFAEGFRHEAHPLDVVDPPGLTIDVAWRGGAAARRALVLSSGLHGVEGPFGAAVQLSLMADRAFLAAAAAGGWRVVMIHALNPFGYFHGRRWNEDGVDLNRNFLADGEAYAGAPDGYRRFARLINPQGPPPRIDFFPVFAAAAIARHGLTALRRALPVGQYEDPEGLFYGGARPAQLVGVLAGHYARWIGAARSVFHLDWHTGLGRWSQAELYFDDGARPERRAALEAAFGSMVVFERTGARALPSRGLMRDWLQRRFVDRRVEVATAEFGTYPNVSVLQALRAENRVWRFAEDRSDPRWRPVRARLQDAFVPQDIDWRAKVLKGSRKLAWSALALPEPPVHAT